MIRKKSSLFILLILIPFISFCQQRSLLEIDSASAVMLVDSRLYSGIWSQSLYLHPPCVKIQEEDFMSFKDTAGYGINIVTDSWNKEDIGKITIQGDTMKAIRWVLKEYIDNRDAAERRESYLYSEYEKLRLKYNKLVGDYNGNIDRNRRMIIALQAITDRTLKPKK